MKKRIILLPLILLALAACDNGKTSASTGSEPSTTQPSASTGDTSTTQPSTSVGDTPSTGNDSTSTTPQPGSELPDGLTHEGTLDDPFNVADARKVAEHTGETETTGKYYIKGIVSSVDTSGVEQYGNATYKIKDEDGTDIFTCFQIYNIDGEKFTSDTMESIDVNDTIVVYGPIVNYKGNTPETAGKGAAHVVSVEKGEAPLPPEFDTEHAGTEADPFTVADARKVAETTGEVETPDKYYIKGVVKEYDNSGVAQYGNVTIKITDAGEEDVFTCFQVYNVGNVRFTNDTKDSIAEGDTIVVYGQIVNYKGNTPETTGKGTAYVVSVEKGEEVDVASIEVANTVEVEVGASKGLNAKVLPSNATNKALNYASANEAVATVNNGTVVGVQEGETDITITSVANSEITATVHVTVVAATEVTGSVSYDFSGVSTTGSDILTPDQLKELFASNVTGSDVITAVTNASLMYKAKTTEGPNTTGLKAGKSDTNGSFTITTSESVKTVKVTMHSWRDDVDTKLDINGVTLATRAKANGEELVFNISSSDTLVFAFTNRAVIKSIVLVY